MESIEEIAERLLNGWHSPKEAINLLIADPAFRRLMAEELAKVDMEPAYFGGMSLFCHWLMDLGKEK